MSEISDVQLQAEKTCADKGIKLTKKRLNILACLMHSDEPLSAYEIAEKYKAEIGASIPAMSVYRMLDFLAEHALVHKLDSANKYIACSHISCSHEHQVPQFLICETCNSVTEIGVKSQVMDELRGSVEKLGFKLTTQQLELKGFCKNCQ
jgi:Fur family zinc uptake transcriptional regulator